MFYGIASENMALSFRVRSFRNILLQDAAYFDQPEHTPGKLITRLATDAPNVKAVKNYFFIVNKLLHSPVTYN